SLGYNALDADLNQPGDLTVTVEALRTVRRIIISGNWPIFETSILSNLTWHAGDRLPEGEFLVGELRKQEADVQNYLHRAGYYDATAQISLEWQKGTPLQVDVRVRVQLNIGFWRLRYK